MERGSAILGNDDKCEYITDRYILTVESNFSNEKLLKNIIKEIIMKRIDCNSDKSAAIKS